MKSDKDDLYKAIETCVKISLDKLGDDISKLSIFCTVEKSR